MGTINCQYRNLSGIDTSERLASATSFQKREPVTYYSSIAHIWGLFCHKRNSILKKIQTFVEKGGVFDEAYIQGNGWNPTETARLNNTANISRCQLWHGLLYLNTIGFFFLWVMPINPKRFRIPLNSCICKLWHAAALIFPAGNSWKRTFLCCTWFQLMNWACSSSVPEHHVNRPSRSTAALARSRTGDCLQRMLLVLDQPRKLGKVLKRGAYACDFTFKALHAKLGMSVASSGRTFSSHSAFWLC